MAKEFPSFLLGLSGVVALLSSSCATAPTLYPAHPLVDQIIKVREGHDGNLTNRACLAYSGETCTQDKITLYPLASAEFRETANKLDFLCNIGGRRFKICQDKPGFCRISRGPKKCTLGIFCKEGDPVEIEYLPVEQYRFLLDANARCASKDKYDLFD